VKQTVTHDGREYHMVPLPMGTMQTGGPYDVILAARLVETLRSRLGRFVREHIVDADPWDDESHAATRYEGGGR